MGEHVTWQRSIWSLAPDYQMLITVCNRSAPPRNRTQMTQIFADSLILSAFISG